MYLSMRLEHLLRYLRALPTIQVHPELDGRSLGIVHSLNFQRIKENEEEVEEATL